MDRYITFVSTWLSSTLICAALGWLLYRAFLVLTKPVEELINLLGLEVPVPPSLSLAGIKADGFVLHWKGSEQKGIAIRHQLMVNGQNIGEISPQDPSLAITGLQPDHGYVVRIIAVNPLSFSSSSEPLRIHTKSNSSSDFLKSSPEEGEANTSSEDCRAGPIVQSYKALLDTISSTQIPSPMQREHSGSLSQQKRMTPTRRQTQTMTSAPELQSDVADGEENIRELTEKLDKMRAETESYEAQAIAEEERYHIEHETHARILQEVQQLLQDKNNASRKVTQQVAALVSEESAARKSKAVVDKQLQQLKQEREKMTDDLARWEAEAVQIEDDLQQLKQDQQDYRENADKEIVELRETLLNETALNKNMEEAIRQTVAQIKDVEEEKKRLDRDEDALHNGVRGTHDDEEEWKNRMAELSTTYQIICHQLQQARVSTQSIQHVLDSWHKYYTSQPQLYPTQIEVAPPRRNSGRRRAPSLRSELSPQYETGMAPFNSSLSSISPNFSSVSPFFNITNGMTIPPAHMASLSPVEMDIFAGGGPTSPSAADGLLPSGLFGDDSESRFGDLSLVTSRSAEDSPQSAPILPGLGAPETLEQPVQGPGSPASATSRSPSVFASPRDSATHLPYFQSSNSFGDSDKRSIRSTATGSSRGINGPAGPSTKFSNFFHLRRQRGKTFSDEGPSVGSLKASESQSLPREDVSPNPGESSRRRGNHSTSWMGQMLGRANTTASLDEGQNQPGQSRKPFTVFGMSNKTDPWQSERSISPRPPSSASSETNNALPVPSAETQTRFGWPISEEFGSQRSSVLGADWSRATGSGWGSRHHSRRPSAHHSLSQDLSMVEFDDHRTSPQQAPIGTRPRSAQASDAMLSAAKLNPTAPTFQVKSLFSRSSADKKSDKTPKSKGKETDQSAGLEVDTESPPSSRKSRDAPSLSTLGGDTASEAGRESLEHTTSRTPSEVGGSATASAPRESFMQKLTRKSSATKFNFPGLKGTVRFSNSSKKDLRSNGGGGDVYDTDEENTAGIAEAEKGAASPVLTPKDRDAKSGGGFSFRSLKRRKGDKAASASVQEGVEAADTTDQESVISEV